MIGNRLGNYIKLLKGNIINIIKFIIKGPEIHTYFIEDWSKSNCNLFLAYSGYLYSILKIVDKS